MTKDGGGTLSTAAAVLGEEQGVVKTSTEVVENEQGEEVVLQGNESTSDPGPPDDLDDFFASLE